MSTDERPSFGDVLRRHRVAAGLTQEELAERAGLSARAITDLERGVRRFPYPDTIARLGEALALGYSDRTALRAAARRVSVAQTSVRRGSSADRGAPNQFSTPRAGRVGQPISELDVREFPSRDAAAELRLASLPIELTTLFGRDRDVQAVSQLIRMADVRVLTLIGPGGVGKTRLAVQVVEALHDELAGRVVFVPLATVDDPTHVVPAIGQAVGLDENTSSDGLKYRLSGEQFLLVLDNFEHLLPARTAVVELVRACPRVTVLITSRSSLRIAGEREFAVAPLATPDGMHAVDLDLLAEVPSVRLFCDRAGQSDIAFQLTSDNASAVAEICRRLDGLPLALELAAARLKLFAPQTLLGRLERRLPILVAASTDRPAHQQTLRGTIEWSYRLLAGHEQAVFRKLAVLVAGWDVTAAETIGGSGESAEPDILSALTAVVDHSLVTRRIGLDGEVRFGMLETIQEFALERLQSQGELAETQRVHAQYFADVAEDLEARSVGRGRELQLKRFRADHDNFQGALRWCLETGELTVASRIVGALWNSWACGYVAEGRRWSDTLLTRQEDASPTRARAKVLTTAGIMAILQDDAPGASRFLREALSIWRTLPQERFGLALALTHLGQALRTGSPADAGSLVDEALALFEGLGNDHWRSMALRHRGMIAEAAGDPAAVRTLYAHSLALARATGDPRGLAQILCYAGRFALREGDKRSARAALEESLTLFGQIGDRRHTAVVLESLAHLAQVERHSRQARKLFAEALDLFREAGDEPGIAICLQGLGCFSAAGEGIPTRSVERSRLLSPGGHPENPGPRT
ncbi:MAG TPA: helix-turn-helix domain-containing protein [Chloroflexota bacterium]|jgi:predicted ATPase/DNA-binding XRE family transcriptional regulator